jgi:formylglycine-generating enzyme required for sulfatase activity
MSDIFISYKREEQATARKLADALENEGWTVWWDPKLRAGDDFDRIIESVLNESRCVIVLWSELSVQSDYVRAEALEALEKKKLVPVAIQNVTLPFRFKRLHTPKLLNWDNSSGSAEFRKLVDDITEIIGSPRGKRETGQKTLRPSTIIAKRESGSIFRDRLRDGSRGPEMVVIPAGTFKMGDIQDTGNRYEELVHTVNIPKPFAIGRYPIIFEDYDRFASVTNRPLPNDEGWGRGRQPAINVSWDNTVEYTYWLSEQTGKRYRLPTEAEWEYAARAGTETDYWWGNKMKSGMANCKGGGTRWGGRQTSLVGSFPPNPFGLYDTAGNVFEWVEDCWHESYKDAPTDGSAWLEANGGDCGQRVLRGGSWFYKPVFLRASYRTRGDADYRSSKVGFRLARDID